MTDRILHIVDLLMGAAHADHELRAGETAAVRELVAELLGVERLPAEVEARIRGFDPAGFRLVEAAAAFRSDPASEQRRLVELVAAVHDADDEIDLAEDDYLRALARALGLADGAVADLQLEYEIEDLRDHLRRLRQPPPIPR